MSLQYADRSQIATDLHVSIATNNQIFQLISKTDIRLSLQHWTLGVLLQTLAIIVISNFSEPLVDGSYVAE